ncbi:riboflavin synthase subunit beta [uncultured Eudoraea sp.]|uniref:riboflavin synthase subunit beta n=1 Tax=uncultured Eudoraea sp. TaxID=1035614 RepID=UPI00262C54E6|nr:riboflavin synthase subunit beta [uncultured Eudoraea sp.]
MGKFSKLRKNRKYKYTPRYYDDKGEGNPYKIQPKLDKFRTTVDAPRGLKGKFSNAMADMRTSGDQNLRLRMLIIIAILILIFLYIIDFDLSIFFSN